MSNYLHNKKCLELYQNKERSHLSNMSLDSKFVFLTYKTRKNDWFLQGKHPRRTKCQIQIYLIFFKQKQNLENLSIKDWSPIQTDFQNRAQDHQPAVERKIIKNTMIIQMIKRTNNFMPTLFVLIPSLFYINLPIVTWIFFWQL